jgi:ParB family chromosome partitioning protein
LGDAVGGPPPVEMPQTSTPQAVAKAAPAPPTGTALEVPIENVTAGRAQPRRVFDEDALDELAASIREKGILQPLVVSQVGGGYELIAGERRLRAASRAGLETVPIVVKRGVEAGELIELALIENIQREDLTPLEEAKAFQRLVEEHGLTQDQVAKRVGKSRTAVTNTLRLLALPEPIKHALDAGKLSEGHARALLALSTTASQIAAARKVMQRGLSVRETEDLVRRAADRKPPPARKTDVAANARSAVEKSLERLLGTKVRIRGKGKAGRIEIDYYSHEELDRLLERLGA